MPSCRYGNPPPMVSRRRSTDRTGGAHVGPLEIHRLVMSVGFSGPLSSEMRGYGIPESELWRPRY